jgi:uncharacterized RDD family membrane protein YckC
MNHPDAEGSILRCSRCFKPYCDDCLVHLEGRHFCADCKVEHVMDFKSGVQPQALDLASVGTRFGALLLDRLIVFAPLIAVIVVGIMFEKQGQDELEIWLIAVVAIWAILAFLYEPLMLMRGGQTLGKRAVGVRVVRPDGKPISTGQAWGRSLGRLAIMMVSSLIDYLPALFTKEKTTIHDMMANTRVVRVG